MQLTGYDYVLDNHETSGGLEQLSGKIAALRNDGIATILCDNGDFLEGSPLADHAIDLADMNNHPMICAMNQLKYDVVALGNHEFDFGTTKLRAVMAALNAPVVCSNVRVTLTEYFTNPWTIVERDLPCSDGKTRKIKIGIIGFVTPQQVKWGTQYFEETLITDDIFAAAMTHLPAMRRAGADIAIGLAHTGIGPAEHQYGMENAAQPLASLRGIDVLMLGHTHNHFPSDTFEGNPNIDCTAGTIHDTPVVMAGHLGDTLGLIDLNLTIEDGYWTIQDHSVHVIAAVGDDAPDPEFCTQLEPVLAPLHAKTLDVLAAPVGNVPQDINTFFSSIGYDPLLRVVSHAQRKIVQDSIANSELAHIPVLGASATFRAGGQMGAKNFLTIPNGAITTKHVAAKIPFNNTICGVLRRGWQIRHWLEGMSHRFHHVKRGQADQPLLNPQFPSYNFDTILGLEYAFDITADLRNTESFDLNSRVPVLRHHGAEVLDDDLFIVATSRYRAIGGGLFGHVSDSDIVFQSSHGLRSLITANLLDEFDWTNRPNWTFTPHADTSVVLKSSPLASASDIPVNCEPLGLDEKGFREFRVSL